MPDNETETRPRGFDFDRQREQIKEIEANRPDPNTDYTPSPSEYKLLRILRDEGRAPTGLLRKRGGFDMNYCSEMVKRLAEEGWIWRVIRPNEQNYGQPEEITGFYAYNAHDVDLPGDEDDD